MTTLLIGLGLGAGAVLLWRGRAYWSWLVPALCALAAWMLGGVESRALFVASVGVVAVLALVFGVLPLRRRLISSRLLAPIRAILPRLGDTERIALDAGTVWWDAELFSGSPDLSHLIRVPHPELSAEERAFLAGPVEQLCCMIDDWQNTRQGDMPNAVWEFIRRERFLGMIIPKEYEGLGFTALGHSSVIVKLASRSIAAAVTVMVPNSLGPAELLLKYGTDEQKKYYLPRLARGEEIPCFALTGPEAGSDAAATQSVGTVCFGVHEGQSALGMKVDWSKRYTTLGPVATLIGLVFRLRDPQRLLGGSEDRGITCALVPSHLPGIQIGTRHDPMGVPFQNGPSEGRGVFVPLSSIIGGADRAGQGWRMIMESLAAGRAISLPALSVGAAQLATRVVGAYATLREQFDTPIGRFEGIEEPLARIAGRTYMMNAARLMTVAALDAGERPAVLSAIVKAYLSEAMRGVLCDAMDVRAGAGICRGPRNVLAQAYQAAPIGITVEGANILTRSMIIYGQGAIRCHPFVQEEIRAVEREDVVAFDRVLFAHAAHATRMAVRAWVLGWSAGWPIRVPEQDTYLRPLLRRLLRLSSAFYVVSDAALISLGGHLKRREKITGRLADALAWMYLASATWKHFVDQGRTARDRPLAEWALRLALFETERALLGVLRNLPRRPLAWLLRFLVLPRGAIEAGPDDRLGAAVARGLLEDGDLRRALTSDIFVPGPGEPGLGQLEAALERVSAALGVETRLRDAIRDGRLDPAPGDELAQAALRAGIISPQDLELLRSAEDARAEAIRVDAFPSEQFAER